VQDGIGPQESALQYEAGIKFLLFHDSLILNTAVFNVARSNVATAVTLNGVELSFSTTRRLQAPKSLPMPKLPDQWHVLADATAQ
jgi:iron complex outermembrane receptor protein